ncbi:hypothetical protein BJ165DRAFT_1410998 [Panaeolus papilionaceus]|nr:hypothetical protein BJ165DRAFT_1410998 [Panaeolus papilionaceus]
MATFTKIPKDVFLHILSCLAPRLELAGVLILDTDPLKSSHYTGNADIVNCMLVCKQWKLVCISNSAFWTVYPCCNTDFDISKIERHLQYSKGSQLELRFDMRSLNPHCVQFCQQIISQESGRIMTLHLELGEYDHLPTILSSQFPSLRTLVCHQIKLYPLHEALWRSPSFMDAPMDWSRFPRLDSFSLRHPMPTAPPCVTRLHLQDVEVNIMVGILERSPFLQSLSIDFLWEMWPLDVFDPPRFIFSPGWGTSEIVRYDGRPLDRISLPHLTHLSVWHTQVFSILKDCPLESLEADRFCTTLESLLEHAPTRINRLKIRHRYSPADFSALPKLKTVDTVVISVLLGDSTGPIQWEQYGYLQELFSRVKKVRFVAAPYKGILPLDQRQQHSELFWAELGIMLHSLKVRLGSWDILGPVEYPVNMHYFKQVIVRQKYGSIKLNGIVLYPRLVVKQKKMIK